MFVTALIGQLHLPTGQLSYCNAGHLPPILVQDGQCRLLDLTETNMLLGIDGDFHFSEQTATIDHGGQIILFTDGVTEAANARKELLGLDRLLELLHACPPPIDDRTVYDAVCRFAAGAEQADDIAILSVTRK
jgi:sigma-B regulation protein RsbU (phosphoserine phosphatase)